MARSKSDNAGTRAAQWGCLGTVVGAFISGLFLLASVIIKLPNEQGSAQPIIISLVQPVLQAQNMSVSVVTATPGAGGETRGGSSTGAVIYQADWSSGLNGWPSSAGWKALNGMLLNDGSNSDAGFWHNSWTAAPYEPTVDNYAIEAEIQVVSRHCGNFGVVARSGYQAGLYNCNTLSIRGLDVGEIGHREFDAGEDWHRYRLEAQGNTLRLIVDGAVMLDLADNRYLSSGQVGLWDASAQINVRSFKVISLQSN